MLRTESDEFNSIHAMVLFTGKSFLSLSISIAEIDLEGRTTFVPVQDTPFDCFVDRKQCSTSS